MFESTTTSARSRQIDFFEISDSFQTSSSEAHPARTSPAPTPKAKASKAKGAGSTSKQSASSESAALVGSLLRTALISELGALTPSSLQWKNSATPAGRTWFVLATSEPTMSGRGAGSSVAMSSKLPTPMASDGMKDGAGGGAGSTYPFRMILGTPTKQSAPRSELFLEGRVPTIVEAMLATSRKTDGDRGGRGDFLSQLRGYASKHAGMAPTPLKSDSKGSLGVMSNGRQKSQNVPTYLRDQKWAAARQIAVLLQSHGLVGTAALPVTYGWMDGLSPWLAGTRIAVGGPRGTSAASLIIEAFGDAVLPQIPEAIGRAILRTEAALHAIWGRAAA